MVQTLIVKYGKSELSLTVSGRVAGLPDWKDGSS